MYMTDFEICQFVKEGAEPAERIPIVAQMNLCNVAQIKEILQRNGLDFKYLRRCGKCGRKRALTTSQIEQLIENIKGGMTQKVASVVYGVHLATIHNTLKRCAPELLTKRKGAKQSFTPMRNEPQNQ